MFFGVNIKMNKREQIRRTFIAINVIDGIYANAAKEFGISENALALLYALDDGREHSQTEICREWCIPKTTLNSVIKDGISKGYITLSSKEHTKEKFIYMTEKGASYASATLSAIYKLEDKCFSDTLPDLESFIEEIENLSNHMMFEFTEYFKQKRGL